MKHGDGTRPRQDQDVKKEDRSTSADAGAAPEQSDFEPTNTSRAGAGKPGADRPDADPKPGAGPDEEQDEDLVDPREKRQDPPVPGQPKKIRVEQ